MLNFDMDILVASTGTPYQSLSFIHRIYGMIWGDDKIKNRMYGFSMMCSQQATFC
jgi:hypothetical protein